MSTAPQQNPAEAKKRPQAGFYFAIACVLTVVLLLLGGLMVPWVPLLKSGSIQVLRWHDSSELITIGPKTDHWTTLDRVSLHAIQAIIVSEDARFYHHSGIDLIEIQKSLKINWQKGRIVRGGSTITQQVVKRAFLHNSRTWWRKIREVLGAVFLECIMSKDEILTWYINLIPFGNGNIGIQQGAHYYFEKSPELLTISEGVKLALLIPSPSQRGKLVKQHFFSEEMKQLYLDIVTRMLENGFITKQQLSESILTGNYGKPVKIQSALHP